MESATTITIKKITKDNLDRYKERHENLNSYDEVIKDLLNIKKEKLDFRRWKLPYLDKEILRYVENGINTASDIRNEFLKKEYEISFEAIEQHLKNLSVKQLLIENEGRPHKYSLSEKIFQ